MFEVVHSNKGAYMFFATVRLGGDHLIYLSAHGDLASELLEKYVEGQRADNEELFAEWDESIQKASSQIGSSASHRVEDGYIYMSTFQNGIGILPEDETGTRKAIPRAEKQGRKESLLKSDLMEREDEAEEETEE